jgi:Asp-tRNA(Asn)/Glu-tRNA(Gln) amidotransferase A subunit family amidase
MGGGMNFRETTIKYIKDILRSKTISEVIYTELQEAHLRKLEAETAAEYANAAMQYNEERIKRLEARLAEQGGKHDTR